MFSSGGLRADDNGNTYWLDADQLDEFDRVDEQTDSDDAFWSWFRSFVTRHGLRPKGQRGIVKATDWFAGESTLWSKPKHYSDMWQASKWFSDAGTDLERRLAVALQAVRSTVRVVDDGARRMSVRLAAEGHSLDNYTNFDERVIQVSPAALLDPDVERMQGIDITTGWALHEASHSAYSESVLVSLNDPTPLQPMAVAGLLLNLLEDLRIERLTSDKFPGFTGYFEAGSEYMWQKQLPHLPTAWGPSLGDKTNAIILAVKWHDRFQPHADASDDVLASESQWWYAWGQRYIAGEPARALIEEALSRLASDPDTAHQLATQRDIEEQIKQQEFNSANQLEQAIRAMSDGKPIGSCPSFVNGVQHGGKAPCNSSGETPIVLTHDQLEIIERYVQSEYTEHEVGKLKFPSGDVAPERIVTLHHPESDDSRAWFEKYRPEPGFLRRMSSAFFFRPSAMQWSTRNLRQGTVDDDELWRAGSGDTKFFEQRVIESAPDTNVTLLVDVSGSMSGSKLRSAMTAAATMCAVLRDTSGVRVRVRAHTADVRESGYTGAAIYKIWDQGEPSSRLGILGTCERGNNFDGYAIGWCVEEMLASAHPGEQNVMFVLADGLPNGNGVGGASYGDALAADHVRSVVDYAQRNGVEVIQIAIDPNLNAGDQARMFRRWIPFTSLDELPMQITNLLKKML